MLRRGTYLWIIKVCLTIRTSSLRKDIFKYLALASAEFLRITCLSLETSDSTGHAVCTLSFKAFPLVFAWTCRCVGPPAILEVFSNHLMAASPEASHVLSALSYLLLATVSSISVACLHFLFHPKYKYMCTFSFCIWFTTLNFTICVCKSRGVLIN